MERFESALSTGWDQRKSVATVLMAIAAPFVLTWLFSSWRLQHNLGVAQKAAPGEKRPPTLPFTIPLFDHLFSFIRNGPGLLSYAAASCGRATPVAISILRFPMYIISGPENAAEFLKDTSRSLTVTSQSVNFVIQAFGVPKHIAPKFRPQTNTEHGKELHHAIVHMLSGARLEKLSDHYYGAVVKDVVKEQEKIGNDWVESPDLCDLVKRLVYEASMYAIYGPYLKELNPTLSDDFFDYDGYVPNLATPGAEWTCKKGIKSRNKMMENIRRWMRHGLDHGGYNGIDEEVEWEPYYGSKSTRTRQQILDAREILDEDARVGHNLVFMWASNANSVPATVWFLLEIARDQSLRERVLERFEAARLPPTDEKAQGKGNLAFDVEKLLHDDLLQSIYAEILRMRVAVFIVREPTTDDYSLRGWHFKKNETLNMSTRTEHHAEDIWNSGSKTKPHPLTEFWAERFLIYPDDPTSGPLKEPRPRKDDDRKEPYFSMDGCNWSWIPYGGGRSLCPGRHFAKREIILTTAILFSAFEIELKSDKLPGPDENVQGTGTMPPKGKVPCRLRRRRT